MKIPLKLNGEQKIFEADPTEKLMDTLRRENLISVKCGCSKGFCGSCTVLLDGHAVPSCIIPVAAVRESEVETLEYFSTRSIYDVIVTHFNKLGLNMCGYCNSGKILATYDLIKTYKYPTRQQIYDMVRHFNCPCTETDDLINGIISVSKYFSKIRDKNNEK